MSTIDAVRLEVADRVVAVQVGAYDAVVSWDDPTETGSRPHRVTWSDGATNYVVVGERSAETLVSLARSLVC